MNVGDYGQTMRGVHAGAGERMKVRAKAAYDHIKAEAEGTVNGKWAKLLTYTDGRQAVVTGGALLADAETIAAFQRK